jgi:hypothetical protein
VPRSTSSASRADPASAEGAGAEYGCRVVDPGALAAVVGVGLVVLHAGLVVHVAHRLGRSVLWWLLITHLFPLIGFLVLILSPARPGSPQRAEGGR